MRGVKAKQARRIVCALSPDNEDGVNATGYKRAPNGVIYSLGARHFYQYLKRELRNQRGSFRHNTAAEAKRIGV